jgi:hypothetical protein
MSAIAPRSNERAGTDALGLLALGERLSDFELLDHVGNRRRPSELGGGCPTVVRFYQC